MEFTRNLRRGMSGDDVVYAKNRLLELGYYADHITALARKTFGADTLEAVLRFQTQAGLAADGVIGAETWTALFGAADEATAAEPAKPIVKLEPSEAAKAICALALTRIGDVYSWGDEGQDAMTNAHIGKHDDAAGRARSIAFRDKQLKYGVTGMRLYDCSGFISWLLMQYGLMDGRRDCDRLWAICNEIQRNELIPGDFLFRHDGDNTSDETHVGLYIGRGLVVHCKSRDTGVVIEGINKSGSGYWHKAGRCKLLYTALPAAGGDADA